MIDRIQNRVLKLAAKIAFSASLAGLLSLSFAFIHRSLLKLGGHPQRGSELSVWIQCEDVYGPILFSLLFLGLAIKDRRGLSLTVLRSARLASSLVLAFAVLGFGADDDLLHLDHFLVAVGICAFVAILLAPEAVRRESNAPV
ncbi:MAG: hypothetical protein H6831_15620 [Planctomycetes bacterium]|nr:hypothetical protein [Planctomycetota bacterium]MCB9905827.1 hypothetical protein [Planctomycetota bacterium]